MSNYVSSEKAVSFNDYLVGIFSRMAFALAITALTSYGSYSAIEKGTPIGVFLSNPAIVISIAVIELLIAILFRALLFKCSAKMCEIFLYVYSFLTGVTFSSFFYVYELGTIFAAFAVSSIMFICCAIIGKFTNVDMTKFGGILFGGLIALFIVSVASIFIPVLRNSLIILYAGVIIFLLYTAYDIQIIERNYKASKYNSEIADRFASYGAFELYLDFINLFIRILQILGRSRSDE